MVENTNFTHPRWIGTEILKKRPGGMNKSEWIQELLVKAWLKKKEEGTLDVTETTPNTKNVPAKNRTLLEIQKWLRGKVKGSEEELASEVTKFFEGTLAKPRVFVEPVVFVRGIKAFDQSFILELLQRVAHCALVCLDRANKVCGDQWLVEEHEHFMSDASFGYETHKFIHINLNNVVIFIRTYYDHTKNIGFLSMGVGQDERELEMICDVRTKNGFRTSGGRSAPTQ